MCLSVCLCVVSDVVWMSGSVGVCLLYFEGWSDVMSVSSFFSVIVLGEGAC